MISVFEITIIEKKEEKEQAEEPKAVIEEVKVEEVKIIEEVKEETPAPTPPVIVPAGALVLAASLKADSLLGAKTVLGPKANPGVELISEED